MAECRVFEVDHPATQSAKQAAIERLGLLSGRVSYVPVDFEVDDLAEMLTGDGFDPVAAERHEHEKALLADAMAAGFPDGLRQFMNAYFDWLADPRGGSAASCDRQHPAGACTTRVT